MKQRNTGFLKTALAVALAVLPPLVQAQISAAVGSGPPLAKNVLLISIDGMHALDFANCSKGLPSVNGGQPYCPNMAELQGRGLVYTAAETTRPSDSFPGLVGEVTGGTTRSAGVFYDVSYDRSLAPPPLTTPYGVQAGPCPGKTGTVVEYDESIDYDLTKLNGGGGINPNYLPRNPDLGCAAVYPHNYIRVNTIFEVIRANGGYTAWSDKHPAYDIVNGPSGSGVNDLYSPEINSNVVNLPNVNGCSPLPDPASSSVTDWTSSFKDIQCYDSVKVNAVLNWIDKKNHLGVNIGRVPSIFGMNFQAVSVGQKLVQAGIQGGYTDSTGTPTPQLLSEIEFVDTSVGKMISGLKAQGVYDRTVIIITAKHGQSPIDPNRIYRIPADDPAGAPPSKVIDSALAPSGGSVMANADEDDISLLWLADETLTSRAVQTLEANETKAGIAEIFSGNSLDLILNSTTVDPRTPDIVVQPQQGVVYTGGKKKIAEHGGFAPDDRNVMLLVSGPNIAPATINSQVQTIQVAPTILQVLGINPGLLQAVQQEGTLPLPGVPLNGR